MATPASVPLNAEPAAPQERADQGLPPKSYAEATSKPYDEQIHEADGAQDKANGQKTPDDRVNVNGSAKKDGEQSGGNKVIFEKHTNGDGEVLTSVKPSEELEASLRHRQGASSRGGPKEPSVKKQQDQTKAKLSSGRTAGEGWKRSA